MEAFRDPTPVRIGCAHTRPHVHACVPRAHYARAGAAARTTRTIQALGAPDPGIARSQTRFWPVCRVWRDPTQPRLPPSHDTKYLADCGLPV